MRVVALGAPKTECSPKSFFKTLSYLCASVWDLIQIPKAVLWTMKFSELLSDVEVQAVNFFLSMYTAFGLFFGWISQHFRFFLYPSGILSMGLIGQFGTQQRHLEFLGLQAPLMIGKCRLLDLVFFLLKNRELAIGF